MSAKNTCRELFLDNILAVSLFDKTQLSIPVPAQIPALQSVKVTLPSTPLLHISTNEQDGITTNDDIISAQASVESRGASNIYGIEIKTSISDGFDDVNALEAKDLRDVIPVLHTISGEKYLCYTLPNSFLLSTVINVGKEKVMSINIKTKSLSSFVLIE